MRPIPTVSAIALAFCAVLAPRAGAAPLDYAFDTVHTQVHASVTHMGMSSSTARLLVQEGRIRFDPQDLAASQVEVVLAVDSLDLGDATWKAHVSAPKWLDAAAHPTIRFVSREVRLTGEDTFDLVGELTLKGVTRPLTLQATLNHAGPHPYSNKPALGVSATGSFARSQFGVDEGLAAVGDTVQVRVEVEAGAD